MGTEKELYKTIKDYLEERFRLDGLGESDYSYYLAITSEGKFPEKILSKVPEHYEIIFSFLKKKNSPDLTGFVKKSYSPDFITVEIKDDTIKLEDVYQAKRYAELFRAKYGFLISTKPIPTTIKRLCQKTSILNIAGTSYETLKLAQFDVERNRIWGRNWFPESPFRKEPTY